MYNGDLATGTQQNTDLAMRFRYRSPREILYVREDGVRRSSKRCPNDAPNDTLNTQIASGWKEPRDLSICFWFYDVSYFLWFWHLEMLFGRAVSRSRRSTDATLLWPPGCHAETATLHVDAVINKIFMILL